jgi:anaerobic selenocysteine-containing dehydrogenase
VTEGFYPERVAEITGVAAERIVEMARDFAGADSAVAIAGDQASCSSNGLHTSWAIYCLNALKGNLETPGGLLFRKEMVDAGLGAVESDAAARAGLGRPRVGESEPVSSVAVDSLNRLLPGLAEGLPYEIDTLLVNRIDPLFEYTDVETCKAALAKVPFLVSITSVLDETSAQADLILPEPVFLEGWEASLNNPAVEFLHLGVQQPVIEQLYESRHIGDLLLEIGRNLDESVAAALPWNSYLDFIRAHAAAVFNSGEGTLVSESVEPSWFEFLRERGFQVFDYSTLEEFWDLLLEQGGWWDPAYPEPSRSRILRTRSGTFEFYSQQLLSDSKENRLSSVGSSSGEEGEADDDSLFLPRFEPPRFDVRGEELPLHLLTYQMLANMRGRGAHLGLLQEMAALHSRAYWHSWVEINPETAAELGIEEGEQVRLISPKGQVVISAHIVPMVMPDVVVMPFGLGGEAPRWGSPVGVNPYNLFAHATESISGLPSLIATRVKLERADEPERGA